MANLVFVRNGQALTTSKTIAEGVGILHQNILALLRKYPHDFETFGVFTFETWKPQTPNGGRPETYAVLNEQQATLLVTYCKNTEAVRKFKVALVKAFYDATHPQTLTEQEAYTIMAEVATRAKTNGEHYQAIYRALKARYQVTKYSHILQRDFADAVQFIRTCEIAAQKQEPRALPKSGKPNLTPLNIPEGRKMYRVSEDFLEKQRTFVYCWRYLFRDDLELFYNFLKQTKSPLAPKFAEAIMDFNLCFVEDSLAKLGFAVKDLDCYKHWAAKRLTA